MGLFDWRGTKRRADEEGADDGMRKRVKLDELHHELPKDEDDYASQDTGTAPKQQQVVVSVDVAYQREELRSTTIFAWIENKFPSPAKVQSWFNETMHLELRVDVLGRGFMALRSANAAGVLLLLRNVTLDYEGNVMHLYPFVDNFDPRNPSCLHRPVWIQLPYLPLEYRGRALKDIGNKLGQFICYPKTMKGMFPRICVALPLDGSSRVCEIQLESQDQHKLHLQQVWYEDWNLKRDLSKSTTEKDCTFVI